MCRVVMSETFYGLWFHCVSITMTEADNTQKNNSTHKPLKVATCALREPTMHPDTDWGVVYREWAEKALVKSDVSSETSRMPQAR